MAVFAEGWTSFGARLRSSGHDESRRGGEQWPVRRATVTLLDLAPLELEDGDGREEKRETTLRPDKLAQRGVRGSSTADAWSGADEHSRRYGR